MKDGDALTGGVINVGPTAEPEHFRKGGVRKRGSFGGVLMDSKKQELA